MKLNDRRNQSAVGGIGRALRDSFQAWRRAPWLAAGLTVLLAVGLGAASGMLALTDRVLLKPLPLPHPDNLVVIGGAAEPPTGESRVAYYSQSRALASLCEFGTTGAVFSAGGRSGSAYLAGITPGFFQVAGVRPNLGRVFSPGEQRAGAQVVIVSHALWQRELGGGAILGRTILLDKLPFTVVGVMPSGFAFPAETSAWVPQHVRLIPVGHSEPGLPFGYQEPTMIGRLRPGVTDRQATASLDQLFHAAFAGSQVSGGDGVFVSPLAAQWGRSFSSSLAILLIAGGFLWFIACADVGWILLVRTVARRREAAIRTVLGAGRGSLLGQLLAECGWLAAWGAGGGLGVALALMAAVRRWGPPTMPGLNRPLLGTIVLSVAGLAIVSMVILCAAASTALLRGQLVAALHRQPFRGSNLLPRTWAVLVIAQVGATLLLAGGAGVLLLSVRQISAVHLGFSVSGVASLQYAIPAAIPRPPNRAATGGNEPEAAPKKLALLPCPSGRACGHVLLAAAAASRRASRSVLASAERDPAVLAAAVASAPPLLGKSGYLWIQPATTGAAGVEAVPNDIGGAYFQVLRIPLLRGRTFGPQDGFGSPRVAVVSATLAKSLWGRRNPLGRRIRVGSPVGWRTVVGVVAAVHAAGPTDTFLPSENQVYLPFAQPYGFRAPRTMTLLVRSRVPGAFDFAGLRRRVAAIGGVVPLGGTTLSAAATALLAPADFWALIAAGAAAMAAVLAWLGVLGLFANWVAQRRHEIGIRMALGATPKNIWGSVLERAAMVTIAGVILGLLGGLAEAGILAHLVFGVEPLDGRIWAIAAALAAVAVFAAAAIPGWRAAAIEPAEELRRE